MATFCSLNQKNAPLGFIRSAQIPDENLFALVETAKEYGVYDQTTGQLPRLAGKHLAAQT